MSPGRAGIGSGSRPCLIHPVPSIYSVIGGLRLPSAPHARGNGIENAVPRQQFNATAKEKGAAELHCTNAWMCSGSQPLVAMMKSADLRKGDDLALARRLYRSRLWAILFEGEVGPGVVIIPQVG